MASFEARQQQLIVEADEAEEARVLQLQEQDEAEEVRVSQLREQELPELGRQALGVAHAR